MKRKPDQVHVLRVELQQKERELLDTYTTAYAVKSWSEPVVNILRDVTATVTILGILALLIGDKLSKFLPDDWPDLTSEMTKEEIMDWLEIQNLVGAGIGGVFGLILGGLLGSFFGLPGIAVGAGSGAVAGAAAGSYTVEELEELQEEAKQAAELSKVAGGILLYHALQRAKDALTPSASDLLAGVIPGGR